MKLLDEDRKLERYGNLGTRHATRIEASAAVLAMIAGLYKDVIMAVIREYLSNAYDGHVAAGTQDIPIDVFLPNSLEPHFEVRDYGTGMTPDQVETVFNNIGQSTKIHTNDLNGCLGAGSKVGFCYSRDAAWVVTSYKDGKKYTYFASVDENGISGVDGPIQTVDTTEPNGISVKLPVPAKDFGAFQDKTLQYLQHFPLKVNLRGVSDVQIVKPEYQVRKDTWGYRGKNGGMGHSSHGNRVIMGTVSYPLDANVLMPYLPHDIQPLVQNKLWFDIFAPMGALMFTPSREALRYDDVKTRDFVVKAIKEMVQHFRDKAMEELSGQTSLWGAVNVGASLLSEWNMRDVVWNGRRVGGHFGFKVNDLVEKGVVEANAHLMKRKRRRTPGRELYYAKDKEPVHRNYEIQFKPGQVPFIIVDDTVYGVDKSPAVRIRDYLNNTPNRALETHRQIWVLTLPGMARDKIEEFFEGITIVWAKDIPTKPRKARTPRTGPRSVSKLQVRLTVGGWKDEDVDMNAGGYYITQHRDNVTYTDGSRIWNFYESLEHARALGIPEHPIVSIPASRKSLMGARRAKKWMHYWDYLRAQVQQLPPLIVVALPEDDEDVLDNRLLELFKELGPTGISEVDNVVQQIAAVERDVEKEKAYGKLIDRLKLTPNLVKLTAPSVKATIEQIAKTYPLLDAMAEYVSNTAYWPPKNRDAAKPHIVEYMHLIQKSQKKTTIIVPAETK